MVSVAFLLSTFLSRSATAIILGFVVFLVGWIVQAVVVFGFPYVPGAARRRAACVRVRVCDRGAR